MMYNTPKLSLTIPLTRDNGEIDANDFNYRTKSVELILDLIERDQAKKKDRNRKRANRLFSWNFTKADFYVADGQHKLSFLIDINNPINITRSIWCQIITNQHLNN